MKHEYNLQEYMELDYMGQEQSKKHNITMVVLHMEYMIVEYKVLEE